MPMYVMIGHDRPDGPERRAQHRPAHIDHIEGLDAQGRIMLAGTPRNDADETSIGSVILFEAPDLAEARAIVARDPYVTGGVFETVVVAPFKQVYPRK